MKACLPPGTHLTEEEESGSPSSLIARLIFATCSLISLPSCLDSAASITTAYRVFYLGELKADLIAFISFLAYYHSKISLVGSHEKGNPRTENCRYHIQMSCNPSRLHRASWEEWRSGGKGDSGEVYGERHQDERHGLWRRITGDGEGIAPRKGRKYC